MPRTPNNPIDQHVGKRVRMRRMMLKMSQEKLGDAIGFTFQQVQKYEKGTNRIGASRLQQISEVLKVPPEFFFEDLPVADLPDLPATQAAKKATASLSPIMDFVCTKEGLALAEAFMRIGNMEVRRRIVDLVEEIVGGKPGIQ